MKKVILIMFIVCALTMGVPAQDNTAEKAAAKKFSELFRAEKYEEALALVNKAIKTYGEKAKWYRAKYYALARMGKYKQAAAAITKKETLQKTTNSRECMEIARTFFKKIIVLRILLIRNIIKEICMRYKEKNGVGKFLSKI